MKMLIGKDSDEIVGFTAFGIEASELMAAVQTAMVGRLPYTVLRDAIFAHPTMAEGLVISYQVSSRESTLGAGLFTSCACPIACRSLRSSLAQFSTTFSDAPLRRR